MNNTLITTAISYTNGSPHIGHMYESILADFIKNIYIISGRDTKLLTGTDEHGKKIEETAIKNNMTPKQLCDKFSDEFKTLNNRLQTKYDHFIRTTDPAHINLVQESLITVHSNMDIYKNIYEGWYNVREESYVSEIEYKNTNGLDPVTLKPYEKVTEETYYFKLSKYQEKLQKYLLTCTIPIYLQQEFLKKIEELKNISISRQHFNWGIPFPFDTNHVVYVWFDALLNYVTGKNILYDNNNVDIVHVIGKDIVWFHVVIYPAILYSLGYDNLVTPNVFVHGHIMDNTGNKMSKSVGNVVDVNYILDKYNVEAVRYYLISNTSECNDINFSEEHMVAMYNNELMAGFGNLFQRLYRLLIPCEYNINMLLKEQTEVIKTNYNNLKLILEEVLHENINIKKYMKILNSMIMNLNKTIQDTSPWKKEGKDKFLLLTNLLLSLNDIMILMFPVIPNKINELRGYLGLGNIGNDILDTTELQINICKNNTNIKVFSKIV